MKKLPSICFVAPAAWSVLCGDTSIKQIGGAEVQQCMIAKGLVRLGYQVSMVCHDHGQKDNQFVHGVRIVKAYNPTSGIPCLRYIHPRATSIWQAMKKCNADIYYLRCAGMGAALVASFSMKHNRRFIYAGAHDTDFMPGQELIEFKRDRWLYQWGLRKANAVIAQNQTQLQLLDVMKKKPTYLCRNLYPLPSEKDQNNKSQVLWVSTIREWKRPELLLDIARYLPDVDFVMAGGPSRNLHYFEQIKLKAAALPNVTFLGFVPYAEIESEFDDAAIFVNTSTIEGFPNTFLQSWSRRTPTISFFSPFSKTVHDAPGIYITDVVQAVEKIQMLMTNNEMMQEEGERCYQYFLEQHEESRVLFQYDSIFSKVMKS